MAVDTSGYANWAVFEEILPYVDLFLYDIKVIDFTRHLEFTGAGNRLILDNFKRVRERGVPVWVRVPLVPGHTDSDENLAAIHEFVGPLKKGEKICLLPYNPVAGGKYAAIGETYPLSRWERLTGS